MGEKGMVKEEEEEIYDQMGQEMEEIYDQMGEEMEEILGQILGLELYTFSLHPILLFGYLP